MNASFWASALAGAALLAVGGAMAEAKPAIEPGRSAVVQALSDCRKIAEDAQRLACYDTAAGAFDQAESKGQVVVIDQEQVKAVRRQAFGFSLPSLHVFDRVTHSDDRFDHVTLDVDSVHRDPESHWVFVTADGAVWRQTDSYELGDPPHKGSKLLVKSGVLGSFFCKVDGQAQLRCKRDS